MTVSKAQQKATNKYNAKNYDTITIRFKKGQKEGIQAHASMMGESTNEFINRAITETIDRDNNP